jgi:transposase, IS5 family
VGQARKFSQEITEGVKTGSSKLLKKAKQQLDEMIPLVRQVLRQTRERVLRGNTRSEGKRVSVFEPQTEIIRKGKASKPNEFGNLVQIQEAENQLITDYQVLEKRPADSTRLVSAVEQHVQQFGKAPEAVTADPGFFSAANESAAEGLGVKRVAIPANGKPSKTRKERQKKRWFKNLQKWRTGCEGRISVLKRRHGLK